MGSNKGRKYHNWPGGEHNPDGSLTTACKNCGLRERLYNEDTYRVEWFNSKGEQLFFDRLPECPKVPTY